MIPKTKNMAARMDIKTPSTITLPISLGTEKKRRIAVPIHEKGAKLRKAVQAAMTQLRASPLRNAVGQ